MWASSLEAPDEWLQNRALNPSLKSRDQLTSHQSLFCDGEWTLLHSSFRVSLPSYVWNLRCEFRLLSRAPSAARGNCSNAGGICFTCNTGRACESREIMEGRKVLSASECLLLNSTHELSGNGSFPHNVTSFKNGYKLAHITAKLQKLTFSFHTPAKDNIMRKPIWMFWELSAPACFAVAGLFRVWQCNAGCQHD